VDSEELHRIARALADPGRMKILEAIAKATPTGGASCSQVTECITLAQPTVSHHLRELQLAGLIEVRSEGRYSIATLREDTLTAFLEELRHRLLKKCDKSA
jgi:ArsR family transcriptional regulator, arsenate/arsenite/antimonite-responsive transcriptional repressor